ncbi:hypothetical protein [Prosthecodimorpha staleyi]|uniref:Translation initiation factor IF-2 n=1 Tax=Prosthecodimorpha staleyi TaxID=2840188 RepID=A0A947D2L4_9HYPH|nr:hypothetical protein [Prosthecodimorpha staleyi]MBT9288446.1 hypothetical protein [Prosthecodimorpha staleyi]
MRRAQNLLLASTLLAGSLAAATAMAQEASGPSTSGGSLPYISGKGTPRGEGPRPDPKRQETSGGQTVGTPSGAAGASAAPSGDGSNVRVIDLSKGGDQSPASGKPAVSATEPKSTTEPKPETAGVGTRPATDRVPGPARAEDAKADEIVPAKPPRSDAETAATTTTPEPVRRPDDAKPVERKAAGKPAPRKTTEATRRDPNAGGRRTAVAPPPGGRGGGPPPPPPHGGGPPHGSRAASGGPGGRRRRASRRSLRLSDRSARGYRHLRPGTAHGRAPASARIAGL